MPEEQILQIEQRDDGCWEVAVSALPEVACESESLCEALSKLAVKTTQMLLASRAESRLEQVKTGDPVFRVSS
jgi:predicted RNase H-like HicB family nuclease